MLMDGQGTQRRRKISENSNRLGRVHERYRQTTDGRTTYSEREHKFTFAKNEVFGGQHRTIPFPHFARETPILGQMVLKIHAKISVRELPNFTHLVGNRGRGT